MKHFADADYSIEKAIARHEGRPYIAKNCDCWDGYERVPGTKPCAPGSCRKCDAHAKKKAKLKTAFEFTVDGKPASLEEAARALNSQMEEANAPNPETEQLQAQFEHWFETQPFPDELRNTCLGSFDQAYEMARQNHPNFEEMNLDAQLRALIEEVFRIRVGGPEFQNTFPNTPNNNPILGKVAAQGDKPSPNAAMDVFETLCSGDEEGAKDMLGMTDCPEGCEVHAEGKCNHGYMSAGRTRVRYLVGSEPFSKEAFGIGDAVKGLKQLNWAMLAKEIGMRGVKAIMANRCPVCEGSGKTAVIQCPACDGTGTFEIVKTKVGDLTEENLPKIKQFIQDAMAKVQQASGGVGAPAPATGELEDLDDLLA